MSRMDGNNFILPFKMGSKLHCCDFHSFIRLAEKITQKAHSHQSFSWEILLNALADFKNVQSPLYIRRFMAAINLQNLFKKI